MGGRRTRLAIDALRRSSQTGSARTAGGPVSAATESAGTSSRHKQTRSPKPRLAIVLVEEVLDVLVFVPDVRCLFRLLERLRCQRRPTVVEHGVRVGLAERRARQRQRRHCCHATSEATQSSSRSGFLL